MTDAAGVQRVEEIKARRSRLSYLLDYGGTEIALVGDDIDWLTAEVARLEKALALAQMDRTAYAEKSADLETRVRALKAALQDIADDTHPVQMLGAQEVARRTLTPPAPRP